MVLSLLEKNSSNKYLHLANFIHIQNFKRRILLGLGSSKPWEDILEEFSGMRTFSAQSCLRYFRPLQEYLEELVEQGQLKVGWTCDDTNNAGRKELSRRHFYLFILMNLILYFSLF